MTLSYLLHFVEPNIILNGLTNGLLIKLINVHVNTIHMYMKKKKVGQKKLSPSIQYQLSLTLITPMSVYHSLLIDIII